ncbi:MAG: trimeric intracellular cation channel family protein [Clostridiales bacterium]|nr:trimeric intracellular cation channel family protein [Clostridiales bacterium]
MEITVFLEVVGIVAFTLVGVLVGIEYELDIFGIYAVSFCSALGGGMIRDLCLHRTPVALTYYLYPITVFTTVTVAVIFIKFFEKKFNKQNIHILKKFINIFDAVGLGMFTVASCQIAVDYGFGDNIIMVVFAGLITSIGGGVLRDLLAARKPVVMRKDVYAVISIFGCVLYYVIYPYVPQSVSNYLVAAVVTIFRLIAYFRKINMSYSITNVDLKINQDNLDNNDDIK